MPRLKARPAPLVGRQGDRNHVWRCGTLAGTNLVRIVQDSRFSTLADYKAALRRGLPKEELQAVIEALANDEPLSERCRPHMLSGNWVGHWECHIRPDWLLTYKLTDSVMVLAHVRTGTHGDLFDE